VGKWLASIGVAGFVLKYRLARAENSPYTVEDAVRDASRAIRVIRGRAGGVARQSGQGGNSGILRGR